MFYIEDIHGKKIMVVNCSNNILEIRNYINQTDIILKYYLIIEPSKEIQISEIVFNKLKTELNINENYKKDHYRLESNSNKEGIINTEKNHFKLKKYKCFFENDEKYRYEVILSFDKDTGRPYTEKEEVKITVSQIVAEKLIELGVKEE